MKELDVVKTMLYVIGQHVSDLHRVNKLSKHDDYSLAEEINPFMLEIISAVEKLDRHADGACEQWSLFAKHYHTEERKKEKALKRVEALKKAIKKIHGVRW